jgi:hypothetical protein
MLLTILSYHKAGFLVFKCLIGRIFRANRNFSNSTKPQMLFQITLSNFLSAFLTIYHFIFGHKKFYFVDKPKLFLVK